MTTVQQLRRAKGIEDYYASALSEGASCGEKGLSEVTRIHPHLLFAGGPRRVGGRYTPMEGPDTLYLASSERAANAEWKAGLQALFAGVELPPKTVFATKVNLTRVLDLSTDEIQRALRTNSAELAQPWKARNRPVTQRLGLACFESGRFSALRYRSTKAAPSYCLAVFPSHIDSAEYVSVLDPQEFFSQIPLTSSEEI